MFFSHVCKYRNRKRSKIMGSKWRGLPKGRLGEVGPRRDHNISHEGLRIEKELDMPASFTEW